MDTFVKVFMSVNVKENYDKVAYIRRSQSLIMKLPIWYCLIVSIMLESNISIIAKSSNENMIEYKLFGFLMKI